MQKKTNDSTEKKVVSKAKNTTAKSAEKKSSTKTTAASKATKKTATSTVKKAATKPTTKTPTQKKATASTKKSTTTKKSVTKTTKKAGASKTTKKNTTKKTNSVKKVEVLEYYDLPYRYNQTVVRILAQTPTTLFVYWDISDDDRKKYIKEFGENFFEKTVPVLIVHNKTMNYSFEIEVNDFANSWYFNVNDASCDYEIELGRKPKAQTEVNLPNNYVYVTSSNVIESPNNHILFEKNQKMLFFKNVKTDATVSKDVSQFEFMKYAGRIYNTYDVYKEIYKHEELDNLQQMSSSRV